MGEFTYEGKPIYALAPVHKIADFGEQLAEMESRLVALREWAVKEKLILTDLHLRNALAISNSVWQRWLRGAVYYTGGQYVRAEEHPTLTKEEKRFVRERADYLNQWHDYVRQWCLDSVASDAVPARSIYISKAIFHNWDTPQEKKEGKIGVELLVRKAKENK